MLLLNFPDKVNFRSSRAKFIKILSLKTLKKTLQEFNQKNWKVKKFFFYLLIFFFFIIFLFSKFFFYLETLSFSKKSSGYISPIDWRKLSTLGFENPQKLEESVNRLRSRTDPSGWILIGYHSSNVLCLQKEGSGGPEELVEEFLDNQVQYAILRAPSPKNDNVSTKIIWDM